MRKEISSIQTLVKLDFLSLTGKLNPDTHGLFELVKEFPFSYEQWKTLGVLSVRVCVCDMISFIV